MAKRRNSNGIVIGSLILVLMAGVGAKNAGLFNRQEKQGLMEHQETPKEDVAGNVKEAMGKEKDKMQEQMTPMQRPGGPSAKAKGSLLEPLDTPDVKPVPNDSNISTQWYDKTSQAANKK